MKLANNTLNKPLLNRTFAYLLTGLLLVATTATAQTPQLSLADLLIGLRSKKVTLPERNTILTDAVRQRGVTFTITPEIEKELETTGASPALIAAIREKAPKPRPVPTPVVVKPLATPAATPVPTPTPPDYTFYQVRADQSAGKGEFALAVADYNKSLELKADNQVAYLNRGKAHYNLKSYDLSVKDFDRAVELNPRDAGAFLNRGVAYERLGDNRRAMVDYQKALDLDPANESAKANLQRLKDEQAAAEAAEAAKKAPPPFVNLGTLSPANAVKMTTPVYSPIALQARVEGKVTVEVELNEEGDVIAAKAVSGPGMLRSSAEYAASKSKFKPAMFNNRPIKGKGVIIYNFSLREPSRE